MQIPKPISFSSVIRRLTRKQVVVLIAVLLVTAALVFSVLSPRTGFAASREDVITQYGESSIRLRQFRTRGFLVDELANQLDRAAVAMAERNFKGASQGLDQINEALNQLEIQGPLPPGERVRVEWLEIYGDIFQKFVLVILAAIFLLRIREIRDLFTRRHHEAFTKQLLVSGGVFTVLGILTSTLGYLRYGESDWSFLDLQLVFTV